MKKTRFWIIIALLIIISLGLASCTSPEGTKEFTIVELATYDGLNGNKAYVAVNGKVYDVTNAEGWSNGTHKGVHQAGKDVTVVIASAPHGLGVLEKLKVVGTLVN